MRWRCSPASCAPVGLPERMSSLVSVIADELLANAIYAAPIDEAGGRFRAHESRETPRGLAGRDVVTLRWATDARYLAIEVRDRWGSLELGVARRTARQRSDADPARHGNGSGARLRVREPARDRPRAEAAHRGDRAARRPLQADGSRPQRVVPHVHGDERATC